MVITVSQHQDDKLHVQQSTDIVRLISEHLSLQPRGREFLGLCPFHDDHSPSMYVSPAKQIYKCFSCGAGGDVFSFVMNYHKLTFPEALRHLAQRAGVELRPRATHGGGDRTDPQQPTDRQLAAAANQSALTFFRQCLDHPQQGKPARDYLEHRRITQEMIESFQIGFAPDRWDGLVTAAGRLGWSQRGLEIAGLISPRSGASGFYDRFRNRVIFPICDTLGRPIAFGARQLNPDDQPKYLNSPETALFHKSSTLFGLHQAKRAIIDTGQAIIVEGYTDVIACHQAGIVNVVATLGTALTRKHAEALSRLCDRVVLIFDADEAGVKAADRAVEVFLTGALDVYVATLPNGQDPADLLAASDGLPQWQQAIHGAMDALEYKLDQVRQRLRSTTTVTGRERIAQEYLGQLRQLGLDHWLRRTSITGRALAVQKLGDLLGISGQGIESLLKQVTAPPSLPNRVAPHIQKDTKPVDKSSLQVALGTDVPKIKAQQAAERHLIGCLIQRPELFHATLACGKSLDEVLTGSQFTSFPARQLYEKIYAILSENRPLTLSGLLVELAQDNLQELADWATQADLEAEQGCAGVPEKIEAMFKDAADWIIAEEQEQHYVQQRRQAVAPQPAEDGNRPATDSSLLWRQIIEHRLASGSPLRIANLSQVTSGPKVQASQPNRDVDQGKSGSGFDAAAAQPSTDKKQENFRHREDRPPTPTATDTDTGKVNP